MVNGTFDSTLGENCVFALAADGVLRCLPTSIALARDPYFSDAACTSPAALTYDCAPAPHYLVTENASTCPVPSIGPAFYYPGGGSTTAYVNGGAGCMRNSVVSGITYYALGPAVSASTFAAATAAIEP